jgi:Helix-turn-helix domain
VEDRPPEPTTLDLALVRTIVPRWCGRHFLCDGQAANAISWWAGLRYPGLMCIGARRPSPARVTPLSAPAIASLTDVSVPLRHVEHAGQTRHSIAKRASKHRFHPTDTQAAEPSRTFGSVRKVYNLTLAARTEAWARQERVNCNQTSALLTAWKWTEELAYLNDVPSVPLQQTLRHLQTASTNFSG